MFTRTHLGHLLHPGDTAVGYDTGNANLVDPELEKAVHKVGRRREGERMAGGTAGEDPGDSASSLA